MRCCHIGPRFANENLEKGFALDVFEPFATQAGRVHDVIDPDC